MDPSPGRKSASLAARALMAYARLPYHLGKGQIVGTLTRILRPRVAGSREVKRSGLKWMLDPADRVQSDLFWYGVQDPWETWHLLRLIRPGDVAFDVGANFGYFSLARAGCAMVHAFEPNPPTFDRLAYHIHLNGLKDRVWPHRLALGDADGTADIIEKVGNSGAATLDPSRDGTARVTTLDGFCAAEGIGRLDLIKLDVEGFESRVLRGATDSLTRFRPTVFVELNPPVLARQGTDAVAVAKSLEEVGYRLFVARRRKFIPLEEAPTGEDLVNAFALPAARIPREFR